MNEMPLNTVVINIIGGPCSGKSVAAAALFAELKKHGIICEYLPEVIKSYIYENNHNMCLDQVMLFAKELYNLKNLNGKVAIIVHDGSLLNNIVYNRDSDQIFNAFVIEQYHTFHNLDFFIDRGELAFQQYGRIHDEAESIAIDKKIQEVYSFANADYITVNSVTAVEEILTHISAGAEGVEEGTEE